MEVCSADKLTECWLTAKFIAVQKEKKEVSIYESLRTGMNDFGYGDRSKGYPRMPVLNADQPAQIVGLTSPDKRPSIETLNLMPPFDRFFIEAVLPSELRFKVSNVVQTYSNMPVGTAAEIASFESTVLEIGFDVRIDHDAKYDLTPEELRPTTHLVCQPYYAVDKPPKGADPLCKSNFVIYIGLGEDGFPAPIPSVTPETLDKTYHETGVVFWVGQDGQAYNVLVHHAGAAKKGAWEDAIKKGIDLEAVHTQIEEQYAEYLPLLYAINSLHNKRTVLQTLQHSRQVRRAAQRNNQQPPDQKTIVIKDFVTVIQGARKAQAEGVEYPLGEVIGHWRRYGVDGRTGLLFGKYRGTFFVPSFLRGNPDKGATDHDYVLKCKGVAA